MAQGTRVRIGRATTFGLGVVLCSGLVGCLGTDSGSKKSQTQLPTKTGTVGPNGVNWNNQPNSPLGANTTTRPGTGATPPAGGVQPAGGSTFGSQPQPGMGGSIGTPTRQGNPAAFPPPSGAAVGGNTFVPAVGPTTNYPVSPAGGTLPQPNMPTSYNPGTPARGVPQEPVVMTAAYRGESPIIDQQPIPPSPPPAFAPPVSPTPAVTAPVAPAIPGGPIAPSFP
jgi:hypothetical protein